jgi:hypothetical protein
MNLIKLSVLSLLLLICSVSIGQTAIVINDMELQHKECLKIKADSSNCSKIFLQQMDSMLSVEFNEVKMQIASDQKADVIKDQMSWSKKKAEFFKIQDETFVYNLKEEIWKKDMIRITYQQKAEFLLKRIKFLLKKIK